jgi:outer membrane protein assembly factor BamB
MQNLINKKTATGQINFKRALCAVAIIAILTTSSLFLTFGTQAAEWPAIATGAYISVAPKLIGLEQTVVVNVMIQPNPQLPRGSLGNIVQSNVGYANVSVTFTKPDGTNETFMPTSQNFIDAGLDIGPGWTESGGLMYFYYTPDQVGNWSVTCNFPGQTFYELDNSDSIYYKPSTSSPFNFTVQTEPVNAGLINGYPWAPLPTEYWTNPVNINNREWSAINGDWLIAGYNNAATRYNPYSTGPTTAHVLWYKQQVLGGLMGGEWGSTSYYGGQTAIVMNGKVYYNSPSGQTFTCIDIRTGEVLYTAPGSFNRGIHILADNYQVAAQTSQGEPKGYLVNTGTWEFYDPIDGSLVRKLTNVPSGIGQPWWDDGSDLLYFKQGNYILTWNLTKVTGNNWPTGLVSNFTIQQPNADLWSEKSYSLFVYPESNVFLIHQGNGGRSFTGYNMTDGAWLYTTNLTFINTQQMGGMGSNGPSGPFMQFDAATSSLVAFDVKTGKELYSVKVGEDPWGSIPAYYYIVIGDMKYSPRFDGRIYAVNMTSGKVVWVSDSVGETSETVQSTWIFGGSSYAGNSSPYVGADGKLYVSTQTNYRGQPMVRFNKLFCVNATTGEFIWNVTGAIAPTAIADGYLLGNNGDNGYLYCFGKGPTSTSVAGPLTNQLVGTGILFTGEVLDQSPAFPGTPAVSEDSMTEQMNYLMQNDANLVNNPPKPNGVPVTISVLDPNGNTETLQTTTDSAGHYALSWTPKVAGLHTITANFEGSEAYWRSSAVTSVFVEDAPTATETPHEQSNTDTYVLAGIAATVIAIAIVGIVLALLIKKRP